LDQILLFAHAEEGDISIENVLIYGLEGTGKTVLVYSFAKWSELPFIEVDISAVLDQHFVMIEKNAPFHELC
jgi:SpoVK/Ycf46/Vps4 family AAA+-type ATPase